MTLRTLYRHWLSPMFLVVTVFILAMFTVACGSETPTATAVSLTPTATSVPAIPAAATATPVPTAPTATPVPSFDAAGYFKGKTVQIVVPYSPGGGYDTFSRMLARYVPRHMPGNPRFVVKNLVGGGGERGIQYTMRADPDGLTMATLHPNFIARELAGVDIPEFSLDSMVYLGALSGTGSSGSVWVRRDVAGSWNEVLALGRPVTIGSVSPGQSGEQGAEFVGMLNGPVKVVYGYGGSSDVMAAMDRGETDATGRMSPRNVSKLFPEWIEDKEFEPLFRWGDPATPEQVDFLKSMGVQGEWSEIPHIYEITNASQGMQNAFQAAYDVISASRGYVLPPGTPDEIVTVWRQSIKEAAQDPDFIAHAAIAGYAEADWGYVAPEKVNDLLGVADKLSPEERDVFSRLLGAK
jgi:tripartite-type tricarboxylate transporter receptor subunit TctC